jgi:hypothetical protein
MGYDKLFKQIFFLFLVDDFACIIKINACLPIKFQSNLDIFDD